MALDDVDVKFIQTIQRYLLKYNGDAHPTVETLAKEVGVDRSTLIRHRHKLVQEGYLRVELSTGRGKSNRYFLTERVAKGSQERVAKGGDATLVVPQSTSVVQVPQSTCTTDEVLEVPSSRTTREESVVVRPENDSPSSSLRSAGSAPTREQGIPGTATCWVCGELVVTSRHGDWLRGFRPDESRPDVWQHGACPGESLRQRQCAACGLPVDPVDEWVDDDPPEAKTSIAGWRNREPLGPHKEDGYGPWFVSHTWPDCAHRVCNMMYDINPDELDRDERAAYEEDGRRASEVTERS